MEERQDNQPNQDEKETQIAQIESPDPTPEDPSPIVEEFTTSTEVKEDGTKYITQTSLTVVEKVEESSVSLAESPAPRTKQPAIENQEQGGVEVREFEEAKKLKRSYEHLTKIKDKRIGSLEHNLEQKEEELNELNKEVQEKHAEMIDLKKEFESTQDELNRARTESDRGKKMISEQKVIMEKIREKYKRQKKANKRIFEILRHICALFKNMKQEMNHSFASLSQRNQYELGQEISSLQKDYKDLIQDWSTNYKDIDRSITSSTSSSTERNFDQLFTTIYSILDFKQERGYYRDILEELNHLESISHHEQLGKSTISENFPNFAAEFQGTDDMSFGAGTNKTLQHLDHSPKKRLGTEGGSSNRSGDGKSEGNLAEKSLENVDLGKFEAGESNSQTASNRVSGNSRGSEVNLKAVLDTQAVVRAMKNDRLGFLTVLEEYTNSTKTDDFSDPGYLLRYITALGSLPVLTQAEEILENLSQDKSERQAEIDEICQKIGLIHQSLSEKYSLDIEAQSTQHHLDCMLKSEKTTDEDIDELRKSTQELMNARDERRATLLEKVRRSYTLDHKYQILKVEKDVSEERSQTLDERYEEKFQEKTEVEQGLKARENDLNVKTSDYMELLRTFSNLKLQQQALQLRCQSISENSKKLRREIESQTSEILKRIRQVEEEEQGVAQLLSQLEEEPRRLETQLKAKIAAFSALNFEFLNKKAKVDNYKEQLKELEERIKEQGERVGDVKLVEAECEEKKKQFESELEKYLKLKSRKEELGVRLGFYAAGVGRVSLKVKEEFGIELGEEVNAKLAEIDSLSGLKSIDELYQLLSGVKSQVSELLHSSRLIGAGSAENEAFSKNQQNLRSVGIHSNLGSIQTSTNEQVVDQGADVDAKAKFSAQKLELEKIGNQVSQVFEEVRKLKSDLNPYENSLKTLLEDHQRTMSSKIDKCFRETQEAINTVFGGLQLHQGSAEAESELGHMNETSGSAKQQSEQIQLEVLKNMKTEIMQIIEDSYTRFGSSQDVSGVHIRSPNKLEDNILLGSARAPRGGQALAGEETGFWVAKQDLFKLVQYVFKVSSLFVNTLADFIKGWDNFKALRQHIIGYLKLNIANAESFFRIKKSGDRAAFQHLLRLVYKEYRAQKTLCQGLAKDRK